MDSCGKIVSPSPQFSSKSRVQLLAQVNDYDRESSANEENFIERCSQRNCYSSSKRGSKGGKNLTFKWKS